MRDQKFEKIRIHKHILLFLFSVFFTYLHSTETSPWLGNPYEFEWRNSLCVQNYSRLNINSHSSKSHQTDYFFNSSLCNSIPYLGAEIECLLAKTKEQRGDVDSLKLTGRYVFQDDIAGDPISLVTGVSLTKAFWPSLRDISSFHHGLGEVELFLSFGKERSQCNFWIFRWWGLAGIGVAERGSPWLRAELKAAMSFRERHELELGCLSLFGLGRKSLRKHDFKGYGSIHHQSVDLALRYTYLIDFVGNFNVEYSYRVYAYNFPARVNRVKAQFLFTFSL